MRVLFTSTRGAGHFGPLVPFARACVRAGHNVLVAAPSEAASMVRGAGFAFRPFADPPAELTDPVFAQVRDLDADAANEVVIREVFGRIDTTAALPDLLRIVDEFVPDVIVRDACELAGHVAAELRGIREIRVAVSMASLDEAIGGYAAPGIADLRREHGLPDDPKGGAIRATPVLTTRPLALESDDGPMPRQLHRFRELTVPTAFPPGVLPEGDAPLVYLSFGSVAPQMGAYPGLYKTAIEALADVDARLLVTVGPTADPAELGHVRRGVRVARWIPQADVMPHVAAMVCHGGSGSTCAALAAGVPLVVLPLFADQPANALQVAKTGAGIALPGREAGLAGLAPAVTAVLSDPRHREAARHIAMHTATLPPVDAAVGLIAGYEEMAA